MTTAQKISFKLKWLDTVGEASCKTVASILLLINDLPAWPIRGTEEGDFECFTDEFLAHLAECWKPILLRQTYPIAIEVERPSFLRIEAEKSWATMPKAAVEKEEEKISAFEDSQNLTSAFGGVTGLLPLWFLRNQEMMLIDTQEDLFSVPYDLAVKALIDVGNEIASKLHQANSDKWSSIIGKWRDRDIGNSVSLLAMDIGCDEQTTNTLIQDKILEAPRSVSDAANQNNEVKVAARMAGQLHVNQIKALLEKIRTCAHSDAPKLQEAKLYITKYFAEQNLSEERPYVQGEAIAKVLRNYLDLPADRPVNPNTIIEKTFKIELRVLDIGPSTLDAVAVWGPTHGPSVILNQSSKRANVSWPNTIWQSGAMRVTSAHELCHLLIDSHHTLSAVDVLNGRMPLRIEQRAKAFAAEFLLPKATANLMWRNSGSPYDKDGLKSVLKTLCRKYQITESVAAWLIEHGANPHDLEILRAVLEEIAPQR